ncbi:mRNA capping enzyme [Macrophomina phaseolina MS6]|uniref:mRNA-capping enzyme subunit alpha n=2 Tax=Macrophomina phaseolina TaxID=35725 RepID=K2RGX2_MACPH|nr:mRNA capping enzyme [Macrophomina phaseolina MS6]KAH7055707.1 mRNA capping enzyme alpha subunit [Macrophomina phaseolina]
MPIPEIPGLKAEKPLADQFRAEVAQLLGRKSLSFPGAQPVSFARKHLRELMEHDYYLCEKTDGIRCLLYFTNDGPNEIHYLIDRKNDYYYVPNLHFPRPEDPTFTKFHTGTIVDGELVYDQEADGLKLRFLVFDCLALDGISQTERQLDKRLAYFKEMVMKPWDELFKKRHPEERVFLPFELVFKEMSFPYALSWMFNIKLPELKHGNDGLIFTCKETPYIFGTDEKILKWKPAHENTIDFRLRLGDFPPLTANGNSANPPEPDFDAKPNFDLMIFHTKGDYRVFAQLHVTDEDWEIMKSINQQLDGRIIECYKDAQGNWRFKRDDAGKPHFRDDKNEANHISTVEKVLESIDDAVSKEDLIRSEQRIREAFKKRQAERENKMRYEEAQARRLREEKRKRESLGSDSAAHNGEPADKRIRPEA